MQYSLEDIVEGEERKAEEFLEYHLEHTFENDLPMYKDFINSICIKYKEFLNDKYVPLAAHFFEKITYNPAKGEKLTWLGSPSQFGYIFSQLANLGFIKFPLTNGEISCSKFAKVCWGLFDLEVGTTLENLQKEMNPNKNTLSDTMRSKFSIPSLSEFSSKKKKPIS